MGEFLSVDFIIYHIGRALFTQEQKVTMQESLSVLHLNVWAF